ncbi:hypothetical protein ACP4OV_009413 [Aristida adscensionis]
MPASLRPASPGAGDVDDALALEDIAGVGCRGSFSYCCLDEPRLRLTVRKLDATCFDVDVPSSATVWELKAAVEDVFIAINLEAERAISWQQVWSHFCLCFKEKKLIDDEATLRAFGIGDGDELRFAQHLSVDYTTCESISKNHKVASHRRSKTLSGDFNCQRTTWLDDLKEYEVEKFTSMRRSTSAIEEDCCVYQCIDEHVEQSCKNSSSTAKPPRQISRTLSRLPLSLPMLASIMKGKDDCKDDTDTAECAQKHANANEPDARELKVPLLGPLFSHMFHNGTSPAESGGREEA